MKEHYLKVYETPGINERIPQIRLSGKWLEKLGYNIGDRIIVSYEGDKLTIQLITNTSIKEA